MDDLHISDYYPTGIRNSLPLPRRGQAKKRSIRLPPPPKERKDPEPKKKREDDPIPKPEYIPTPPPPDQTVDPIRSDDDPPPPDGNPPPFVAPLDFEPPPEPVLNPNHVPNPVYGYQTVPKPATVPVPERLPVPGIEPAPVYTPQTVPAPQSGRVPETVRVPNIVASPVPVPNTQYAPEYRTMPKATYQTVPVPQSGRVPEKQFSPQSIVYTQTKEKGKETGKETEKEPIHEGNTITDRVTNTLGSGAPFGYPPKVGGNAPTGGNVVPPPPPDNYRPPVGGIGVSPTSVTPPPPPKTLPPPTPPTGGRPPSQGWNTQLINKQRYIQSATERDFLDAINLSRTLARTQREAEIAKRTRALERYDENQQKVDDIHKEFRTVIQAEKRKKIEEDIKQGWNNFKEGWNEFWTDIGEGVVDGWNWLTTTTSKGLKAFISLCFSSAGDAEAKKPIDKQRIIALERYEENQRTIDNIHNEFTELMKEHKRRKAYEDGLMSDTYDYTIVSGDTYNGILSAFGVDGGNRGLIASLNKIENLDKIFAGQVLKIPKSFITKYPSTGTEGTETGNGGEEETPPETGGEFTTEELSKGWKYVAGGSVLSKLLGRDSTLSKILKKEYTMPSAQSVASSQAALKQELVNKTKGKIPTPKIDELLSVVLDSTLTKSANSALSALRTLDEVAQVLGDTLDTTIPGTNINFGQTLLFLGSVIGAGLMLLQGNTSGVSNLFK